MKQSSKNRVSLQDNHKWIDWSGLGGVQGERDAGNVQVEITPQLLDLQFKMFIARFAVYRAWWMLLRDFTMASISFMQ